MSNTKQTGWLAWFARNPIAANLLMMTLLIVGLFSAANMRTEAFPSSAPNSVTIDVEYQGGSPEVVEEGVAEKIEDALQGVSGIEDITSTVTSNSATILVQGVDAYPVDVLKDDVKIRVDSITTFSDQVQNIVIAQQQDSNEVIYVQVYGEADHRVLKKVAQQVRDRLLELPKINKVDIQGMRDDEITIELNEEKLRAYGLSFSEVATAINDNSINLSAGELKSSAGVISLQSRHQRYQGHEFNNIVIRSSESGGLVLLEDIATVHDGYTDDLILSEFEGKDSINLDVQLIGKDSITEASDAVKEAIAGMKQEAWIPENVELTTWADDAVNIRNSLSLLSMNGLMGIMLVLIVLTLFLNTRVAFFVAIGIPVSFAGAMIIMGPSYLNYSLNELSIFAFIIVLGIVVDDAIVIGENIHDHKKRDTATDETGRIETAIRAAKEVATPATFGVLTTVAAFYPLTTITGNFGGPFRMIAIAVILCLLFSLIESKLILPAHMVKLDLNKKNISSNSFSNVLKRIQEAIDTRLTYFIQHHYKTLITLTVKHRYQSLTIFVAFFVLTIGLVTGGQIRSVFMTDWQGSIIVSELKTYPGTPAEETHDYARQVGEKLSIISSELKQEFALENNPIEVSYVFSSDDQSAKVTAQLVSSQERPFSSSLVLNRWREASASISGIQQIVFFAGENFAKDLLIELSSTDDDRAIQATKELQARLVEYTGVNDVFTNLDNRQPELAFSLKPEARLFGLTENEVMSQIRSAIFGYEAQRVQRGDEELRVKVRYPEQDRRSISDLEQIRIQTDNNGTVPLERIVSMKYSTKQSVINRKNGKRVYTLQAKVDKELTSPSEIVASLDKTVFPELKRRYPDVVIDVGGDSEAEGDAINKLASGFLLGLLMIYALLAIPLKSYVKPVVIMLCIPFGIIGAIWGHFIVGIPFNILSFFGILALSGVVVNDSLVLVSRYNQLREQGKGYKVAVVHAGMNRFKAILLTSITTFVGLFPLILESAEQAQILIPMAVSLAFGILFATVITLFIVPVLLGIHEDMKRFFVLKLWSKRREITAN